MFGGLYKKVSKIFGSEEEKKPSSKQQQQQPQQGGHKKHRKQGSRKQEENTAVTQKVIARESLLEEASGAVPQGLWWYTKTLLCDSDGDVAHQFVEARGNKALREPKRKCRRTHFSADEEGRILRELRRETSTVFRPDIDSIVSAAKLAGEHSFSSASSSSTSDNVVTFRTGKPS